MAFHSYNENIFDGWKAHLNEEYMKEGWNVYDQAVRGAVDSYRNFHKGKSGYVGPSWQLIKAMLWVEGGGPHFPEWKVRPMQIGAIYGGHADGGVFDVCNKPEMAWIAPPEMRQKFNVGAIRNMPELNIKAGLALLHLKLAVFGHKPGKVEVRGDDYAFSGNRQKVRDTRLPPPPRPPKVKYISAWLPFCPVTIYQRYNMGDASYASKLEYCLTLINS